VSTQLPHAVGIAYGIQYRGENAVVMAYFGDGATSEGDFHEAANFAGVWHVPVIFVCQNNQWAISVPLKKQTNSRTIAQKASAYGFPGIQVDGNDVLAVYAATGDAVVRARRGDGPSLLECKTYRWHFHAMRNTLPAETRSAEEIFSWKARDPIARLEGHGRELGMLSAVEIGTIRDRVKSELDEAVAFAEQSPFPDPKDLLVDMFAA
jgi:TPP-dependent pyruvate/acetoin dehydrogenase alpha subunit